MEFKWSNDDYGNGSYQTSVFNDKDGSVSGVPNSYILFNDKANEIAIDDACEIKPTWNAAVCKGDVGRMTVGGGGGGRGAGAGRGAGRGGAPAAAAPGGRGGAAVAAAPGGRAGAGRGGAGVVVGPRVGFLGARAPAGPPVVLSRDGKELDVTGAINVRAGSEIKVTTERPSVSLSVTELDKGSWVIFDLPGFTTAASGTAQNSLDALRKADTTSYYKGNGELWVKLVSSGDILGSGPNSGPSGGASLQASR
jgi:cell migration-inducing and hyaluronan-binding protein